jgi:hypothetical protein
MGVRERRMKTKTRLLLSISAVSFFASNQADACWYHWLLGLPEPTGVWPTTPSAATTQLQLQDAADDAAITSAILSPASATITATPTATSSAVSLAVTPAANPSIDTYVTSWMINSTGVKGRSTNAAINAAIDTIPADIQEVAYTSSDIYVKATGIPDYNIGPFNGNPNIPANDNATFDIPRSPQPATTHTATGLGAIGVLVNGVDVFNMSDSNSYQNKNVWFNNAGVVEASSFDANNAHPQQQGVYHNHENPVTLEAEIGASSTKPMVIGYAIDGYPIMNDYASLTPGGPVDQMMSGYELRTYSNNIRGNGGPTISAQYPDGYFEQDYQYVPSQALPSSESELDQYNGAFVYIPQFPADTYAYFATTDSAGTTAAYPYLVGPDYYGTPASDDLPGSVITVPSNAVPYTVPEPTSASTLSVLALTLLHRRNKRAAPPARRTPSEPGSGTVPNVTLSIP